jgi:hypothetical protein
MVLFVVSLITKQAGTSSGINARNVPWSGVLHGKIRSY